MKNICDWNNCNEIGEYKAPVEKDNSKKFRLLCLNHVKEFNKNWNYFSGMNDDQVIDFLKSDMVWHKPTQSFSSSDNFFKVLWNNTLKDELDKEKLKSDFNHMGQFRYNHFYNIEKHHSIFLFSQLGKSQRSMLDRRFLIGGGVRNRITPSKNSGYIDIAYGAFFENEKYPQYTINQITEMPSKTYNNLRLTLNVFSRLKLNKHWNLVSVMYSQWKSNRFENYRIFFDSTLNYIISKKATIFLKFNARIQSEPYIPFVSNETDTLIGFRVSI